MAKKTKRNSQSDHQKMLVPQIYSNSIGIGYSDTEVVINFGFSTPSYLEPHNDEDIPAARIVLSWDVAEELSETVKEVVHAHKKPQKTERKGKSKAG
jgi:hypothetical protein